MLRLHISASFSLLLFILHGSKAINSALLGESCDLDKECLTRQMVCEGGVCNCIDNHNPSEDRRSCIATAGASCYEATDCDGLANSECHVDEKRCVCLTGYQPSDDNLECLAESRHQGSCKSSVQCTTYLGDFGICENELCTCKAGYHFTVTEQKCIMSKYLNEDCVNATQCITKDLKESEATCNAGRCVCLEGKKDVEGSCRDGANHLAISWITVFAYCIVKFLI